MRETVEVTPFAVAKWKSCEYSTELAPPRVKFFDGVIATYGCTNSEVIEQLTEGKPQIRWGQEVTDAILHDASEPTNPSVIKALEKYCADCPYYQPKTQRRSVNVLDTTKRIVSLIPALLDL